MSNQNNGGPAFPTAPEYDQHGSPVSFRSEGMTLRDYFAAKALQGFCAGSNITLEDAEAVPYVCYQLADTMLAERAK